MDGKQQIQSFGTPPPEWQVDTDLVRRLLTEQHPDLASLPIEPVAAGWDNFMFRLGERLAVRLPRRQLAATLIENEQTWLPLIAKRLPIAVPSPYRVGSATTYYPWRWSILPWLTGVTADFEPLQPDMASFFASCLVSLHLCAPANAPVNRFRGVPLSDRAAAVEERLVRLATKTDLIDHTIKNTWHLAINAPLDTTAKWLHGDLHPRNILVENGRIVGIIDWGDLTAGDVATDLAAIWMLFDGRVQRERSIEAYGGVSQATIQRAKGWAILFGAVLLDSGLVDDLRQAAIGKAILERIAQDN
jgi:aminoglycoside phosphotransferase (APT) family kinase protein